MTGDLTDQLAAALRSVLNNDDGAYYEAYQLLDRYAAYQRGVQEANSDVTTHFGPDMIEDYDAGRASVRGPHD